MPLCIKRSARAQSGPPLPEETHEEILRRRDLTRVFMSAVREQAPPECWLVECLGDCKSWSILHWRAPACSCDRTWQAVRFTRLNMTRDRALKLAAFYRAVQREGLNEVAHRLCLRRDEARVYVEAAQATGLAQIMDKDPAQLDRLATP